MIYYGDSDPRSLGRGEGADSNSLLGSCSNSAREGALYHGLAVRPKIQVWNSDCSYYSKADRKPSREADAMNYVPAP